MFPFQHPLREAETLKVEVWGLTAVQTPAGARGRPPHPPELTALTGSGWEGPRNLHPARKSSLFLEVVMMAGEQARFGADSD